MVTNRREPILSFKEELIIRIPVTSEDVAAFTKPKLGEYSSTETARKIFTFIHASLARHFVEGISFTENQVRELVRNSYDAYAAAGLKKGEHLELKVVIGKKIEDDYIVIKIKDNGTGFKSQPKSHFFTRELPVTGVHDANHEFADKKNGKYLGGVQRGLYSLAEKAKKLKGASFKLKNRKEKGCTVYSIFSVVQISDPKRGVLLSTQENNNKLMRLVKDQDTTEDKAQGVPLPVLSPTTPTTSSSAIDSLTKEETINSYIKSLWPCVFHYKMEFEKFSHLPIHHKKIKPMIDVLLNIVEDTAKPNPSQNLNSKIDTIAHCSSNFKTIAKTLLSKNTNSSELKRTIESFVAYLDAVAIMTQESEKSNTHAHAKSR